MAAGGLVVRNLGGASTGGAVDGPRTGGVVGGAHTVVSRATLEPEPAQVLFAHGQRLLTYKQVSTSMQITMARRADVPVFPYGAPLLLLS